MISNIAQLMLLAFFLAFGCCIGCDNPKLDKDSKSTDSNTASSKAPGEKESITGGALQPAKPGSTATNSGTSNSETSNSESTAKETAEQLASAVAAKKILDDTIAKYKSISSYEDAAVLKIRIPLPTEEVVESKPMQIAYESPNKLAIRSLSLQSSWTQNTFESIVRSDRGSPFGNERLVRPRPRQIDLKWLIIDHLRESLDTPGIGTPLQLQLLFDTPAIAYLTSAGKKLSLLKPESFDGAKCDRVQILDNAFRWVLWIDPSSNLVRKFELPPEQMYGMFPNLPPEVDKSKMELTVEMTDARDGHRIDWRKWQVPTNKDDLFVRRFIDPPPGLIPPLLGKKLKPFDLRDGENRIILDSAQRTKPLTLLCWVGPDEQSEKFVAAMLEVNQQIKEKLRPNAHELLFVSTSPAKDMTPAFKKWKCDVACAIDTEDLTQKTFDVSELPTIVVLDKDVTVQHFDPIGFIEQLPDLMLSLQEGKNIAARRLQQQLEDEARFISRLRRVVVEKDQLADQPEITPFPFVNHLTKDLWTTIFEDSIIAAAGEQYLPTDDARNLPQIFDAKQSASRVMTVLDELGKIYSVYSDGTKQFVGNIPIEKATDANRIHVAVDAWQHAWVAIIPEGLPRFWVVASSLKSDTESASLEATEYALGEEESPTAFAWAGLGSKLSLLIATNKNQLFVLDPETGKLQVGNSLGAIAILPTLDANGNCIYWNLLDPKGETTPIVGLRSSLPEVDAVVAQLSYTPEMGSSTWGMSKGVPVLVSMADLSSGEAGAILQTRQFEQILAHPLSVRPRECRIQSSTTLPNQSYYWLSTAPKKILHLQSKDWYQDQMSFGKSIEGAALFPSGDDLRMVVALDNSVSCWSIQIPRPRQSNEGTAAEKPAR
jgi:hypothetical protein